MIDLKKTYEEAKKSHLEKNYLDALSLFQQLCGLYPNNEAYLKYMLDCLFNLEKYSEVIELISKAINHNNSKHSKYSKLLCDSMKKKHKEDKNKENLLLVMDKFLDLWNSSNRTECRYFREFGYMALKCDSDKLFLKELESLPDNSPIMNDKHIADIISWCYYNLYIKNFDINQDEFKDFIEKARYITEHTKQKNAGEFSKNPYVLTIAKVVRVLRKHNRTGNSMIVEWLLKLDPSMLPNDNCYTFEKEERNFELASTREFYYQQLTRAYEKMEKYDCCLKVCNEALDEDIKWHYQNKKWITARKHYCICRLSKYREEDIKNYRKIVEKDNFWYMYHKLSQIYYLNNRLDDAIFCAFKAFDTREKPEKLVNIMVHIAILLSIKQDYEGEKMFAQASGHYRKKFGWNIGEDLDNIIKKYTLDLERKPNLRLLKEYVFKKTDLISGKNTKYRGRVINILKGGKSGFIKDSIEKEHVYFRMTDIINHSGKLELNDKVKYEKSYADKGPIALEIERIN